MNVTRQQPGKSRLNRRGFTMVEMMVALALFGVVIGVAFAFLVNTRRGYTALSDRVEYQQSMRAVMSLMSREVRSAGSHSTQGTFVLFDRFPSADQTSLRCLADLDNDGNTWSMNPAEDVVYDYDSGAKTLTRDTGTGPQVILRNVESLNFEYFDAADNPLNSMPLSPEDLAAIRRIHVEIEGETDGGEPMDYETTILIRNN